MKRLCQLLLIFSSMNAYAQTPAAPPLRNKVITLHRFLNQNHYLPVKWNDTSSAMLFDKWMKELDDEKLFFTQNEITVLENYKTKSIIQKIYTHENNHHHLIAFLFCINRIGTNRT